ncbi:MAG: NAD(P)H-dependent oxidoreductase subunit E [Acidobacteriota bacterium]|jgi:NADH:ubiquinone oxidoreductase subunit E
MPIDRQRRLARSVLVLCALVASLVTAGLFVDHVVGVRTSARLQGRIQALEEAARTDREAAGRLHEQREKQTAASVARERRGGIGAWLLLAAVAGLVAGGKWHRSLAPAPSPALQDLLDARRPDPSPGRTRPGSVLLPAFDPAFVDALIDRVGRSREAAIPILQGIQDQYRYLPDEALRRVCERTEITPAQIAGTSSFYAHFRRSPVGRTLVRVCHGTACHVAGAGPITEELRRHLGIVDGEDTDPERRFTIDRVACLGCCSLAPVMMVEDETVGHLSPASARRELDAVEEEA